MKAIFKKLQAQYKHFVKRKKLIAISIVAITIIGVIGGISSLYFLGSDSNIYIKKEKEIVWRTVHPQKLRNENIILIGKVISNETAKLYPRRQGIVKDIYIDIGDQVEENQVLGILLPQGVEGQSNATIAEKRAKVLQAEASLRNAKSVAQASINNAKQTVTEKQITLENSKKNKDALLTQVSTNVNTTTENEASKVEAAQQKIAVAQAKLKLTEESLEKQKASIVNQITQAESNIKQEVEQAEIAGVNAQAIVESAIFDNSTNKGITSLNEQEINASYGALSSSTRQSFITAFNALSNQQSQLESLSYNEKKESIFSLIENANTLLVNTQKLLNKTAAGFISQSDLSSKLSSVIREHNSLLGSKENLEDALNSYEVLLTSTSNTITTLENQIKRDQELLKESQRNAEIAQSQEIKSVENIQKEFAKQETSEFSKLELFETQLKLSEENLSLVQAKEQQSIDRAENDLKVARAGLTSEYTASGHIEMKSAFSGVISKRYISVGEVIINQSPVFELVEVETTLSKNAKREIQFGLPEDLNGVVALGESIEFFSPVKEEVTYSAIVSRISPQIDEMSHNIIVQAKLSEDTILPHHMSVRVRIPKSKLDIFQVPSSQVKREDNLNHIWSLVDKTPEKIFVNVVAEDGEFAQISGEISEDTMVIKNPPDTFLNETL